METNIFWLVVCVLSAFTGGAVLGGKLFVQMMLKNGWEFSDCIICMQCGKKIQTAPFDHALVYPPGMGNLFYCSSACYKLMHKKLYDDYRAQIKEQHDGTRILEEALRKKAHRLDQQQEIIEAQSRLLQEQRETLRRLSSAHHEKG